MADDTASVPTDALSAHAVPLATTDPLASVLDPDGLDAVFGDASVVGLGEATHGTREFFRLKHRLIRYLVREHDLRVVAMEANFPETLAIDEYVVHGRGTARDALDGIYFWTWNVESVLSLLEWLRTFNSGRPVEDRVRFYGVDMQYTTGAVARLRRYFETVDATLTERIAADLETVDDDARNPDREEDAERRRDAAERVAETVRAHLDEHRETYIERGGRRAWRLARRQATVVERAAAYRQACVERLRATNNSEDTDPDRRTETGDGGGATGAGHDDETERAATERLLRIRDRAMADTVDWLLGFEDVDCLAVWAHDAHINRSKHEVRDRPIVTTPMGGHLAYRHGDAYVAVGFTFGRGSFQALGGAETDESAQLQAHMRDRPHPGTVDAALDRLGDSPVLLDLRAAREDDRTRDWVGTAQRTFSAGATYDPDSPRQYLTEYVPGEAFDALCHVAETSRARPAGTGSDN